MATEALLSSNLPTKSLSDPPAADQLIQHGDKTYTTVKEGLAYVLIPPEAPRLLDPRTHATEPAQSVFYNPIQQYNRDLTVLAIKAFGEDWTVRNRHKRQKRRNPKGKRGHEDNNGVETNGSSEPTVKRRKVDTDTDDVTFGEIDDEDLLAVESSMQEGVSLPQIQKAQNGAHGAVPTADAELANYVPPFRILDALSATGLRALRYAQELPFVTHITANDLSPKAVESIRLNITHNKLGSKIKTATGNANGHMYSFVGQEGKGGPGQRYHVIDIDPYGTAVPFLDAAVQATTDGGLLCVTCTDTGVFNSMGYAEKAFSLYGGLPGKGDHCHEIGLRLILHAITTTAAKYGISVEPLLSLSVDYYARVFVRVRKSPSEVKFLGTKTMLVYACDHGCGFWTTQPFVRVSEQQGKKGAVSYKYHAHQGPTTALTCECCGGKMHVAGPMYGGPLHNPSFIEKILDAIPSLDKELYPTLPRIEGMLSTAQAEMLLFDADKLLLPLQLPKQPKTEEKQGDAQDVADKKRPDAASAQPENSLTNDDVAKLFRALNPITVDHHPFYFIPSSLARVLHCQAPPDAAMRGALKGLGYATVRSHARPGTIKTDAPWSAIWDVMYAWVTKEKPIKEGSLTGGMAGVEIMKRCAERVEEDEEKEKKSNGKGIVFDEELGREDGKKKGVVRYQMNPRANWGPMARAK